MSKYIIKGMDLQREWDWIAARAECVQSADSKGMVAYRDGEIACAVAFDHWSHNSVHIHTAFVDLLPFKHGWPEAVFDYVFNQCDKGVIMGVTPASNVKAVRFNKHIGFVELFRVKDGFEVGIDFVVTEYRKENCKYLRNQDGQIRSRAA
jgi:hypothetical protein